MTQTMDGFLHELGGPYHTGNDRARLLPTENVRAYGAKGDGSDDTAAITQAVATAVTNGTSVYLPDPIVEYKVTTEIPITGPVHIFGDGPGTVIRQATWGRGIFDVYKSAGTVGVSGVFIENLKLQSTEIRALLPGPLYRGENNWIRSCGIWLDGDRCEVRNVWITGFVTGVHITGLQRSAGKALNNRVIDCEFDTNDYGILCNRTKGVILHHLRGTASISQTGNPAHLIYFTGSFEGDHENATVTDVRAYDITEGHAIQVKRVSGGIFANLHADNCTGILNLLNVVECDFSNLISRNTASPTAAGLGGVGGLSFQNINEARNRVDNAYVEMTTSERAMSLRGDDSYFTNLHVRSVRSVDTDDADILITGNRVTLDGVVVDCSGARAVAVYGGDAATTYLRIANVMTRHSRSAVQFDAAATNCSAFIDKNLCDVVGTSRLVEGGRNVENGIDVTGNRPNAVTAGVGARFYDSSTLQPLWSDGAAWKPAGGDPVTGSYAPGSFTIPTDKYAVMTRKLQLTGTQRATLQGTSRLRIT